MKWIGRTFLAGLAAVVPVIATLYLVYWLAITSETALGGVYRALLPPGWYWPGMGLVTALLLILLTGILMHAWLVQKLYGLAERLLYRIPLVRSIYGSIRDLFNLLSKNNALSLHQTVIITIGEMRLVGFVTRNDLTGLPDGLGTGNSDNVVVYLPMSYMIGGYMIVVPKSVIEPVEMSVEEAMRFALTAGVASTDGERKTSR